MTGLFPLPAGHVFGPPVAAHYHDGSHVLESLALRQWQQAFTGLWRRPRNRPSGRYDAHTQKAVVEIQGRLGLPLTGLLGPSEWAAVWELPPPPKKEPPPKPPETPLSRYARHMQRKKIRDYWAKYSRWHIRYGSHPTAPYWFPGRPFGPHETGPHVQRVRELLGLKPEGKYSQELTRKVRGYQRAHDLPVSGIVDARTASMLDPPESEAKEDPPPF